MSGASGALFEQAPVALYLAREDGSLVDVNDAFVALLGFASRAEAVARPLPPPAGPVDGEKLTLARADGSPITLTRNARKIEQQGRKRSSAP